MIQVYPLDVPLTVPGFDLFQALPEALRAGNLALTDGDVLAIPARYVSAQEGRFHPLDAIHPSPQAVTLAHQLDLPPAYVQLALDASDRIIGRASDGALITLKAGATFRNAGLDLFDGGVVLSPPEHPAEAAQTLRTTIQHQFGARVGVVVVGEVISLGRRGAMGVALAAAGFIAVSDETGKPDLFGRPLQFTTRGLANMLAAAALLGMAAKTQIAHITGSGITLTEDLSTFDMMGIPFEEDLFSGLLHPPQA